MLFFNLYETPYKPRTDPNHLRYQLDRNGLDPFELISHLVLDPYLVWILSKFVGVAGSNATSRKRHSSLLDSINQSSGSTPSHSRVWMSQINQFNLAKKSKLPSEPGMNPFEVCGALLINVKFILILNFYSK